MDYLANCFSVQADKVSFCHACDQCPVEGDPCDQADDHEAATTVDHGAAVVGGDHGLAHHLHSEPHSRVLDHINVPALHTGGCKPVQHKTLVGVHCSEVKYFSVELRAEFHKSVGSAGCCCKGEGGRRLGTVSLHLPPPPPIKSCKAHLSHIPNAFCLIILHCTTTPIKSQLQCNA